MKNLYEIIKYSPNGALAFRELATNKKCAEKIAKQIHADKIIKYTRMKINKYAFVASKEKK